LRSPKRHQFPQSRLRFRFGAGFGLKLGMAVNFFNARQHLGFGDVASEGVVQLGTDVSPADFLADPKNRGLDAIGAQDFGNCRN